MRGLLVLLACLWPTLAAAEEVVAGLSQNRVAITANFDGSEILIFGAVKREAPIDREAPLHVIVTVAGPAATVAVRKKERRAGIWVNTQAVEVADAPSFYAVATSAPLAEVMSGATETTEQITIGTVLTAKSVPDGVTDPEAYKDALIRIRSQTGAYQTLESAIAFSDQTLFDTRIALPASLVEGTYATRILLTRSGAVVSRYETEIDVRKVGLERFLYNLAQDQALLYGLLSLAIAIAAGWTASAVFRYLQGQS